MCPLNCLRNSYVYPHKIVLLLALLRSVLLTMVTGDCRDSYLVKVLSMIIECPVINVTSVSPAPGLREHCKRMNRKNVREEQRGGSNVEHSGLHLNTEHL